MTNFEKRDIVEVAVELGIELTEHLNTDRPYYTALCPLHQDRTPSFVVMPGVQRWRCYACSPKFGDVIDLVRAVRGVGFEEAKRICCEQIEDGKALLKELKPRPTDLPQEARRLRARLEKVSPAEHIAFLCRLDAAGAERRARMLKRI